MIKYFILQTRSQSLLINFDIKATINIGGFIM